jgi:hypothetical protein
VKEKTMTEQTVQELGARGVTSERCQHYFLKTLDGTPIGCVMITPMALTGEGAGQVCRGISLCSSDDAFSKVKAQRDAFSRIRRAVGTRQSSQPIQNDERDSVDIFFDCAEDNGLTQAVINKSAYDEAPTKREKGILYHLVKRLGGEPVEPAA